MCACVCRLSGHEMVSMVLMAQEDAGMIMTDQDVMKKIRAKKSSTKLSLRTPLASLPEREKQTSEIEGRGGPYGGHHSKRQRETKNDK